MKLLKRPFSFFFPAANTHKHTHTHTHAKEHCSHFFVSSPSFSYQPLIEEVLYKLADRRTSTRKLQKERRVRHQKAALTGFKLSILRLCKEKKKKRELIITGRVQSFRRSHPSAAIFFFFLSFVSHKHVRHISIGVTLDYYTTATITVTDTHTHIQKRKKKRQSLFYTDIKYTSSSLISILNCLSFLHQNEIHFFPVR